MRILRKRNKMKYKMVVADFDGTLGIAPGHIEESTVRAIREYREKGGVFVVCTGRMLSSIRPICLKYGLTGDVIAAQGAIAAEIETGNIFYSSGISAALAREVVTQLESEGEIVLINVEDVLYYAEENALTDSYEKNSNVRGKAVGSLSEFLKKNEKPVQKVMAIIGAKRGTVANGKIVAPEFDPETEPERFSEVLRSYAEQYDGRLIVNSGFRCLIEIISPDCTKGDTVRAVAKRNHVAENEVLTVGDSTNDLSLLSVGHGVAVGDGSAQLKAVAKEIAPPYAEKPVEYLLKKYCL